MDTFIGNVEKVIEGVNKFFVLLACLIMAALVAIVCADVFLRYFLRSPLVWSTEVTEILLLDLTFLGTAWVFREDGHVVIDVFTAKASERRKRIHNFISYALVGITSIVLIVYGFSATYDHFARKVFNPTAIETPIALIIMIIPVGSVPLFFEVLFKLWKMRKK
jgi:TRAP-type C4-dicarboxylate transport system permease small subunit